jgi:3-oxoacyl-[acyl-carrier protein] reductase
MLDAGMPFGGVDLLVNNAGIFPRVDFLEMTDEQFDEVIDVNLKGAFRCSQMLAQRLVADGRGGGIVNLASSAAFRSSPRGSHYVSSKAGIVGLTRATALELAAHHIRVNAIAPGLTDTAQPRFGMSEAEIAETSAEVPLGQMASAENVADLVVFLLSQRASHITGQTMHVNGGQYLY